jgi:hypothetical protein
MSDHVNEITGNILFPVFLKLENKRLLLIGGGKIALEKLNAVINNSPKAKIKIVAKEFCEAIIVISKTNSNLQLIEKEYQKSDFENIDIAIAAVNDVELSRVIANDANEKGIWINVADKPELCDFYLSSIVQKGNLKIAISTNGLSPTLAKRLKEMLQDVLPEELDDLLENLNKIRGSLKGDFASKVEQLNELTKSLVSKK